MAEPSQTAAKLLDHDKRLSDLEEWRHHTETLLAVRQERDKHMDDRFDRIEKAVGDAKTEFKEGVGGIKGDLKKLVWLIVVAIVGGIMQFVMSGGLSSIGN